LEFLPKPRKFISPCAKLNRLNTKLLIFSLPFPHNFLARPKDLYSPALVFFCDSTPRGNPQGGTPPSFCLPSIVAKKKYCFPIPPPFLFFVMDFFFSRWYPNSYDPRNTSGIILYHPPLLTSYFLAFRSLPTTITSPPPFFSFLHTDSSSHILQNKSCPIINA